MTESLRGQITMAETMLRESEERISKFRALGEQLRDVVGRGEAAEGKVVAEWKSGTLERLEFDPKVMRMPSGGLAIATQEAISAAIRDCGARTRQVLAEAGLEPSQAADPEQLQHRLAQVREQFTSVARHAADGLDEATRHLDR